MDEIDCEQKRALTARGTLMPEARSAKKLEALQLEHKIAVEDDERRFAHDNVWTSCCLRLDKRGVVFFAQLAISVGIAGFSVGMMAAYPDDCATFSRYSPLLTLVGGIWLPQPNLKNA